MPKTPEEEEPKVAELGKKYELPEPILKMLEKGAEAQSQLEVVGKRLMSLEEERATEKFEKRASEVGSHLPGKGLGSILKNASQGMDKAQYEALETTLRAANELVSKSNLFSEVGHSGAQAEGSSKGEFEALAESIQKSKNVTIQKARLEAAKQNPGLYAAAQSE